MVGAEMYTTIKTLWNKGNNKSYISRTVKHDWKTVDKIIKILNTGQDKPERKERYKLLDKYQQEILEFLEQDLSCVRIHQKLIENGVIISYSSVKNYVANIKSKQEVFIRFNTAPGEEAQVDFGYIGSTVDDGKRRKTWVFNMRLSYSRLDYYEKVYDQKVETFIKCHINAFKYFNGVPKYIKIDNLKAAILEANFYEPVYQEYYKALANYYGFQPLPCRVCKPNEKGKVESGIKYVKNNFFAGRKFTSGFDLNKQLREWMDHICNMRVHGTTRRIPRELFAQDEQICLLPLPQVPFRVSRMEQRTVYKDCHIFVDYSYYSVPYKYIGKTVDVEIDENIIRISYQTELIALHTKCKNKQNFSTISAHYPKYKCLDSSEYIRTYRDKIAAIGDHAFKLFELLLERQPTYWYRTVQGILSLRKYYKNDIIDLSCYRAIAYDAISYKNIKSICDSGCYTLPIEYKEETWKY